MNNLQFSQTGSCKRARRMLPVRTFTGSELDMTFGGMTRIIGAIIVSVIFSLGLQQFSQGDRAAALSLLGTAIAGASGFIMLPK